MGSGDWLKKIISGKKTKLDKPKQPKGSEKSSGLKNLSFTLRNNAKGKVTSKRFVRVLSDDVAATMIQTAFRAYMARKTLRRMKGIVRFQKLTERKSVRKQCTSTLTQLHSWSRIQTEIRERRLCMVSEDCLKQKKLDSQLKLEAKLHDFEKEWNNGADTKEEILARVHHREEAVAKRERSMAYAFNHQWRANSKQNQGSYAYELGKANWGWSWKERWITSRPWEFREPFQSITPKKVQNKSTDKIDKLITRLSTHKPAPCKSATVNVKPSGNGSRRLSFPGAEKPVAKIQTQKSVKQ